jgi:hypothetical protein
MPPNTWAFGIRLIGLRTEKKEYKLIEKRQEFEYNSRAANFAVRKESLNSGALAQLGERVLCKHEVGGPSPLSSTKLSS